MKNNNLDNSLLSLLTHSAVAGVGLSAGRDIYRKSKDDLPLILIAVLAFCGTAYGMWNMTRGHDRGPVGTFFLTFLANALLMAASVAIFMVFFLLVAPIVHQWAGAHPVRDIVFSGLTVQSFLAAIGLAYGIVQRPARAAARKVDRDNALFLASNGFRDVGGREKVMLDGDGNELVLEDVRTDAVVFKVKGRRGVRAKILLSDGRMVSYVPAKTAPER